MKTTQTFGSDESTKCKLYLQSGHVWKELPDGRIDIFALDYGNHNGPQCVNCGYNPCWHCEPIPAPCPMTADLLKHR